MKLFRSFLAAILSFILLLLGGCSAFVLRTELPVKVHLQYNSAGDVSQGTDIFTRRQDAVVSLVSIGSFSVEMEFGTIVNVTSGVIINREGYVLSTEFAARPTYVDDNGETYTGTWTAVYAVLPEAYGANNALYRLEIVNLDEESGLSLFLFYDQFFISENDGAEVEGFPIVAEFASADVPGQSCFAIGNAVGNVINEVQFPYIAEYFYRSVTSGIVAFVDDVDDSLFITAAVSPEMYGGAILDQNGYMIGLISEKLQQVDEGGNWTFTENVTRGIGVKSLLDYLEKVSAKLQIPIPYTVAISEVAE